ncbi:MAG: site-specific integrase [Spirochaetales bacterium]|nr:site-specific integrase [Spirochaetales bacterium]
MAGIKKEPKLIKRTNREGWHFYYYDKAGVRKLVSTGETVRHKAEAMKREFLASLEKEKISIRLRDYAAHFFTAECPHRRRLRDEGKSVTARHNKNQRIWLENYIKKDPISNIFLNDLTRADVIDFRSRLKNKLGEKMNTLNKVMETLKVITNEALIREDMDRDPFKGIGPTKYEKIQAGIFTMEELNTLFVKNPPWQDIFDYTAFLIAATLGRRRGEILALRWQHVDLDEDKKGWMGVIHIHEAWKGGEEYGGTKTGVKLDIPLPRITAAAIAKLKEEALNKNPDMFLFGYPEGKAFGETWWRKRFLKAMDKAEIDVESRHLKPHSFRHTLNTILRERIKDPALVRAYLGWTNERTQDGYTHFQIEHLQKEAEAVDGLFG